MGPVASIHLYQAFKIWASQQGERFIPSQTAFGIMLGHFMPSVRKRVEVFAPGLELSELRCNCLLPSQSVKKQVTLYYPHVTLSRFADQGHDEQIACYVCDFQLTLIKNIKNYRFGDY